MYHKIDSYCLTCDNCGETFTSSHDGYSIFIDENQAHEYADNEGWNMSDKHYCEDCHTIDDDDNLIVNADRTKKDEGTN